MFHHKIEQESYNFVPYIEKKIDVILNDLVIEIESVSVSK